MTDFDDHVRRVIAEQHDEIAALRAENERLRGDLDTFIQACEELHDVPAEDEILRLEKENVRLRGLVTEFYSGWVRKSRVCTSGGYECHNYSCPNNDQPRCRMHRACIEAERMGIEVKP